MNTNTKKTQKKHTKNTKKTDKKHKKNTKHVTRKNTRKTTQETQITEKTSIGFKADRISVTTHFQTGVAVNSEW
jgi:hypothetical protein